MAPKNLEGSIALTAGAQVRGADEPNLTCGPL